MSKLFQRGGGGVNIVSRGRGRGQHCFKGEGEGGEEKLVGNHIEVTLVGQMQTFFVGIF